MSIAQIIIGVLVIFFIVFILWDLFGGDIDKGKFDNKK